MKVAINSEERFAIYWMERMILSSILDNTHMKMHLRGFHIILFTKDNPLNDRGNTTLMF